MYEIVVETRPHPLWFSLSVDREGDEKKVEKCTK
jgi:hypothetical protein